MKLAELSQNIVGKHINQSLCSLSCNILAQLFCFLVENIYQLVKCFDNVQEVLARLCILSFACIIYMHMVTKRP